ncbi:hypothetical protein [Pseudomonas monteilii]|uniref:hypothetical protein n=1 Tax=Pseudomonas monteilii TaxID=76759 RepID=UPI001CBC34EF|nr:hypothetical protein [Pseudomonas monteilii]
MNVDPRDLFVSLNPLGLDDNELEMDSSGFADQRTHGDYLLFLAGYKAGTVDGEQREFQRHRPINAEGCKPETLILFSGLPCAGAAVRRGLDKAEGSKPDNITAHAAALDVLAERCRQIDDEGYTTERDDQYIRGQLADAAGAYAFWAYTCNMEHYKVTTVPPSWPWSPEHWKPTDQRKMLVRAGALILAEIERLDRQRAREVIA